MPKSESKPYILMSQKITFLHLHPRTCGVVQDAQPYLSCRDPWLDVQTTLKSKGAMAGVTASTFCTLSEEVPSLPP